LFLALTSGLLIFYLVPTKRQLVLQQLRLVQHWLFKLLSIIMWLSPAAAFAAMAFMLGKFGIAIIWHLLGLVLTMISACLFFILVILGSVARVYGFNLLYFLRWIKDEIILVFATSSSESALGPIMHKLKVLGVSETVIGIVVPAGYSFNLDGTNIYLALVIAFLCQAFNIHLSWQEYLSIILVLMVTSKGAAGVSGAGFIVLAGTLGAMNGKIPVATIAILLGIDKIMSELRSTTNLIGNSVAAIVIARMVHQLDQERLTQVLSKKLSPSSRQQPRPGHLN
jgi:aerobic C4-dicarboxylate transport protein